MGQVIEIIESVAARFGLLKPVEFGVIGTGVVILIDEIDQLGKRTSSGNRQSMPGLD